MPLTIGQVAHRAGLGVETVRFYERRGLIEEPPRKESGYRQYPEDVVARLRFIRRAKELGFSLKEIAELFSLRVDPDTTCADIKRQAEAKITTMDEKISSMQGIQRALTQLAASCSGTGPAGDCPILETLESQEKDW